MNFYKRANPMITTLPEIAVVFCEECLGWEGVQRQRSPEGIRYLTGAGSNEIFFCTDFDSVVAAVRSWLKANALWVEMKDAPGSGEWIASYYVYREDRDCIGIGRDASHFNALLWACIYAARKLA